MAVRPRPTVKTSRELYRNFDARRARWQDLSLGDVGNVPWRVSIRPRR